MPNEALQGHYERKYADESKATSIEPIVTTSAPRSRAEAVVKFFPRFFKGGDVLEIGAGDGRVAKAMLSSDLAVSSYTLGDISSPRLEGVQRNLDDSRARILELDAENVPESEYGKYDAVIMLALIEHLIDPLRAMQGIGRLLKPGGFVYIDTPNMAKYTRRIKLLFGRFPATASWNEGLTTYSGESVDLHDEGHLHYFTYRSLTLMLVKMCGFSNVIKLAYPGGETPLGRHVHYCLAALRPELFSELAVVAYA